VPPCGGRVTAAHSVCPAADSQHTAGFRGASLN
jgi:hypothetical protein